MRQRTPRKSIKFFPVTIGPMRKLTERGILLRRTLAGKHLKVIEVYPGGAQDILGIPRKQYGLRRLRKGLEKQGIEGLNDEMTDHELDAVTCALVGKLFLEGKTVTYGTREQAIIMPKSDIEEEGTVATYSPSTSENNSRLPHSAKLMMKMKPIVRANFIKHKNPQVHKKL